MKRPLALALVLAWATACATPRSTVIPAPPPLVGQAFALAARDLAGREVRVEAGRVHVVDFWATWCDPCLDQLPVLDALAARHGAAGLAVVGVAFDEERGAVESFLVRTPVSFPIVWDRAGETWSAPLGIDRLPTTVLVDRRGVVRSVHLGFEPGAAAALEAEVTRLLAE
jgi:thiol-disulfide isomerase/thioredoxin